MDAAVRHARRSVLRPGHRVPEQRVPDPGHEEGARGLPRAAPRVRERPRHARPEVRADRRPRHPVLRDHAAGR